MAMCSTTLPSPSRYMKYETDSLDPLPLTPSTFMPLPQPHPSPPFAPSCYPEAYIDLAIDSEHDQQSGHGYGYGYESDCEHDSSSHSGSFGAGGGDSRPLPSSYIFPSSASVPYATSLVHPTLHVPSLVPSTHSPLAHPHPLTPPLLDDDRPLLLPPPGAVLQAQKRMNPIDMNMAVAGTLAASPGINTPLAQYAASMVVWLWYGNHSDPHPQGMSFDSPRMASTPDPFLAAPINPDQIVPTPYFLEFVSRMLRLTQVSHSVTLIALLYIYRLKARNPMVPDTGSEMRPFVASLLLGNKYLDDNTYTNRTWADLAGMPQREVNKMEFEFLEGMNYDLSVSVHEYRVWLGMLDGFIAARQRDTSRQWYNSHPPFVFPTPLMDSIGMADRARSASPSTAPHSVQPYIFPPSPPHAKKRTAVDAFAGDVPAITPSGVYEQLRFPARKAHFQQQIYAPLPTAAAAPAVPELHHQSSQSSLGRSSSLNRQIARLPGDHTTRRGSVGNAFVYAERHGSGLGAESPMGSSEYYQHQQIAPIEWTGPSELIRPYERPPQGLPVQHGDMSFYAAAADPHPGPDGAPRKGILRQQPAFPIYSTHLHPTYGYDAMSTDQPFGDHFSGMLSGGDYLSGSLADANVDPSNGGEYDADPNRARMAYQPVSFHANPEPGQFANAGPPGWIYHVQQPPVPVSNPATQRWSMGSDEGLQALHAAQLAMMGDVWRTRSEWNSPMTGVWHS